MFNELEIIKRLNLCSENEEAKTDLIVDFGKLTGEEKEDFLLIMKNLKETFIIRNLEVEEDGFTLNDTPYLTDLGKKYLKSKS